MREFLTESWLVVKETWTDQYSKTEQTLIKVIGVGLVILVIGLIVTAVAQ